MKTASEDPVVDEIRTVRRELSDRFGNSIDALCDFLAEQEKQHEERLVNRLPNLPQSARTVGLSRG
jgi:hypothetical protein